MLSRAEFVCFIFPFILSIAGSEGTIFYVRFKSKAPGVQDARNFQKSEWKTLISDLGRLLVAFFVEIYPSWVVLASTD